MFFLKKKRRLKFNCSKHYLMKRSFGKRKLELDGAMKETNTAFFHQTAKIRNATNQISLMKKDNLLLDKVEDIEEHVLSYYKGLFAADTSCQTNDLIQKVIPSLVTVQDNAMLTNVPSMDEVK